MREPNEIDFWRGFALAMIFVSHIPKLYFESFTLRHYSLSDSAELFVFLAGWGLQYLADRYRGMTGIGPLVGRLYGRALTLYVAQIAVTSVAIAMLAYASVRWAAPDILVWNNVAPAFDDPVRANVAIATLTYHLNYFDILPLYVVLMAAAPLVVVIHRAVPVLLLPLSLAIYVAALLTQANLPSWPAGTWYFNPLSWQLVFVMGFVLADERGLGALVRRHHAILRRLAIPVVMTGMAFALGLVVPPDGHAYLFDKTFEGPVRLAHHLAIVALFAGSFWIVRAALPPVAAYFALLGRNSLHVFCAGSLFSLGGQLWLRFNESEPLDDGLLIVAGLAAMGAVAWLAAWRRSPAPA